MLFKIIVPLVLLVAFALVLRYDVTAGIQFFSFSFHLGAKRPGSDQAGIQKGR
jgi:hypothetical protein